MKTSEAKPPSRLRWIAFYVFFYTIGLVISFWFGLGWFMLFQFIPRLLFAIPKFYFPTIRFLAGTEFMVEEKKRRHEKWFTSPSFARNAFIALFVTFLTFWKANIPLYKIIEIVIR